MHCPVAVLPEQASAQQTLLQDRKSVVTRAETLDACMQGFTADEQAKLDALKRSPKPPEKGSRFESVLAELEFIEWPPLQQAAVDTGYVLLIVVGASAFLFAINSVLAQAAQRLFA